MKWAIKWEYEGKILTCEELAPKIEISASTIRLYHIAGCKTVADLIAKKAIAKPTRSRIRIGKQYTFEGNTYTTARALSKALNITEGRVTKLMRTWQYKTGEEILEHLAICNTTRGIIKQPKSALTLALDAYRRC